MEWKLYSFDVFDTLITRSTATPAGIFALMQERLIKEAVFLDIPERIRRNFCELRLQAETIARRTLCSDGTGEILLPQIYLAMIRLLGLEEKWTAVLSELEVSVEYANSIPVKHNIAKLRELINEGQRVILISDMYMESGAIRRLLSKSDDIFSTIPLYISGECGGSKRNGTLFQYVKKAEQVEYSQWFHFGDNAKSDCSVPERLGIHTGRYPYPAMLPWEEELTAACGKNAALQLLVGTGRNLRLDGKSAFPYLAGSTFSAPLLLPYVKWLLKDSCRRGCKHLFFIARDGFVLKEIADRIIGKTQYPIKTHYIYGSRRAWRLPSIEAAYFDLDEFLKWSYYDKIGSIQELADTFGLTKRELGSFLPGYEGLADRRLSNHVMQELIGILKGWGQKFVTYLCGKHRESRENAIAYLRQELEGMTEDIAFVDLIGSGYTQKCLADLTQCFRNGKLTTYFYCLGSGHEYPGNTNYTFYPNRLKLSNIIEALCNAEHGQTIGYRQKDGLWEPVFCNDEGLLLEEYGFRSYMAGITDYTGLFMECADAEECQTDDLGIAAFYISYLSEMKNRELYEYFADMPYGITGREHAVSSFAPVLSDKAIRQIFLTGRGKPVRDFYIGNSLEFSLLRLTEEQKKRVARYQRLSGGIAGKLFDGMAFGSKYEENGYLLMESKIVLYGAGNMGQLLYRQLAAHKGSDAEVLLWVDKEYDKFRRQGLWVEAPEAIAGFKDVQVVIAVKNQKVMREIKAGLLEMGIPGNRIIWVKPVR